MTSEPIYRKCSGNGEPAFVLARRGGWLVRYPRLVWRHRDLVWNLTRREILGRFRGSLLGTFWVLAQPALLFAVYYVIFGVVFAPRLASAEAVAEPGFAIYLFAGVVAWSAFAAATSRMCTMIIDGANLVRNAAFPSELLAIPLVLAELVVYLVGAALLVIIATATGALPRLLLGLPLVLVVHVFFTLGVGLSLATLQVFVRDTAHAYGVVSIAWLFASPVFWRLEDLTGGALGPAAALLRLNPVYPLLQAHRAVLGAGGEAAFLPNLGAAAFWTFLLMTIGYAAFVSQKDKFADLV